MNDLIKNQLETAAKHMDEALAYVEKELIKIRAGKANPDILDGINIEYYGNPTPISQLANINSEDARTIKIEPWEKTLISQIEKAIKDSNLGITPQNDGNVIRLKLPILTEERRLELVKKVKAEGEQGKVNIRNVRKHINEKIKKLSKEGVSEDEIKIAQGEVQKITDKAIASVEKHISIKENEIMTV